MIYGYLRVSSDEQDVNSQKQGVKQFCKEQGWNIDKYITDEGVSGGKRPDPVFLETFNKYVRELKDYEERHADKKIKKGGTVFRAPVPEWVVKLLKSRYDIKFLY